VDDGFGKHVGLGGSAGHELVRLVEGCFEVDLEGGGYVAQDPRDRDQIWRGHDA
jgi:hypothetical protein